MTPPQADLPSRARAAFDAAVRACDPEPLVRHALRDFARLEPVTVLAIGKASAAMARGVPRVRGGLVVVGRGSPLARGGTRVNRCEVIEGSHPIPDKWSFQAGRRVLRLMEEAACTRVVVLLSGGASAMAVFPARGVTIGELAAVTKRLLASGLPIADINCVRRHLDGTKGGALGARFFTILHTLALSDVVGDDAAVIGSGPTVPDPTTAEDAARIMRSVGLGRYARLAQESSKERDFDQPVRFTVIANHERLARAAGENLGIEVRTGVVEPVARLAADYGRRLRAGRSLVAAGEPTLMVRGKQGRGGRAQQLALMVAREIAGRAKVCFLAAGSDGIDGPTDAAGAIVTGETWPEAKRRGLCPARALARRDAYPVLDALGALVRTGPTGTNVGDLHVLLAD